MRTGAGGTGGGDRGAPLIAAVRAGDTDLVESLLLEGSDPDVRDLRGTPALCLAIAAYSGAIAQLLAEHGADPRLCGADGVPALVKAVDSGSPALAEVCLHARGRGSHRESELLRMLNRARDWHEAGAEAELRRRTGARGAVVRTRVQDDDHNSVDELTLGGLTVRDGHAGILTRLEAVLGMRTSFDVLMDRALARPDQDDAVWSGVTILLAQRCDQETWIAAEAQRTRPEPVRRLFGAEVLRLTHLFDGSDEDPFAEPALDLFVDWSVRETDPTVLTEVLVALGEHTDPRADASLVPHAGHPDARVRRAVASGFGPGPPAFRDDARQALLALMTDPDTDVRRRACRTVAQGRHRAPAFADAMAGLLRDPDRQVRVLAVHGLARHDDERCVEGHRRLPPAPPGTPYEYDLDEVWRYERRRDGP